MKNIKPRIGVITITLCCIMIMGLASFTNHNQSKQILIVRTFEGKGWTKNQGIYLYYGNGKIEKQEVSSLFTESANDIVNVLNRLYSDGWKLSSANNIDGGSYYGPNNEYVLEK